MTDNQKTIRFQETESDRLSTTAPDNDGQVRRDALEYIAQLSGELSTLARQSRFDLVAYFLDMAAVEAGTARRKLTNTS